MTNKLDDNKLDQKEKQIEPGVLIPDAIDPELLDPDEERQMLERQKKENPVGFAVIVREFKKDKIATFSFFLLILILLIVFVGAFFVDPDEIYTVDIFRKYEQPNMESIYNIFGRDPGGLSVLGLLIVGAKNSIIVGFSITLITTIIGVFLGLVMGYYGGIVDTVIMRIIDFFGTLPTLMMIITLVTIIPRYNMFTLIVIMSIFYWPGISRLVRSKSLSESRRDYVNASKTMGTNDLTIMFGGILPNISSIIIVDSTLALAGNIGIETSLSFLGFGLPASTPSLGTLVSYARRPEVIQDRMFVWLPAAVFILVMMLCINYVGQALRRASDARQRLG